MRGFRKTVFLFLCLLIAQVHIFSQTEVQKRIDSLNLILRNTGEDTGRVNLLIKLSWEIYQAAEFSKGSEIVAAAIKLAEQLKFRKGKAGALNVLGTIEWETGNYDKALECFLESWDINLETGNKQGCGDNLNNIGNIHYVRGQYAEAIKNYQQALRVYEEIKDTTGIIRINNNMGSVYVTQGNHTIGIQHYFEVLKISQGKGDKSLMALCNRNIGEIYFSMMNYPEAINYYEKALSIYQQVGRKVGIANTYRSIGKYYEKLGHYEEALINFSHSRKIFFETGDSVYAAQMNGNIGSVYLMQSRYDEALKYFQSAIDLYKRQALKKQMADSYNNLGEVLYRMAAVEKELSKKQHIFSDAISYLNKGQEISKEIGAKESLKNAYGILSDAFRAMHDYKNALEYNHLYVALKDSLLNNETTRKLEQLRTKYEVEKAVNEEKAQKEKELTDEKKASMKKLAEMRLGQEIQAAEEKYRYELALANENAEQGKIKAEEQIKKEQALAEEKYRSGQVLAATISKQGQERAAIKQRKDRLLMGAGMLVLALAFGFLYLRQQTVKQRAVERAEAGHKMAELELQSLRAQLNPHFMFNSLNAIQDLILKEDNDRSHLYLSRFSKLLRMLLDNANQPFVSVNQEVEFLELYLSLENLRIPDLKISIDKDPKLNSEERMIPNMMLQPYIENAIWHGLSNKKGDRKLQIRIHENGNATEFEIEDNGVGRKKAAELKQLFRQGHHSKGMELLSKRFNLLSKEYGAAIQTVVTDLQNNGDAAGTLVKIDVPFTLSEQANQLVHDQNHHS